MALAGTFHPVCDGAGLYVTRMTALSALQSVHYIGLAGPKDSFVDARSRQGIRPSPEAPLFLQRPIARMTRL